MKNVTIHTIKVCAFYIMFFLFSCGQQQQEITKKPDSLSLAVIESQDTIKKIYRNIDTDTLISEKQISINNEFYKLKIIKYCSNDSAVVNELFFTNANGSGTYKELDIAHNYFEQIILSKDNEIIFDKLISKDSLKDLVENDYKRLRFYDIQYDFVNTNRLNFKATLITPDTNRVEETVFAIFYQTEKVGQLDFSKVKLDWVSYDDLDIYDLMHYSKSLKETVGFVSMSDNYSLNDHPDSLAIPGVYSEEYGMIVHNDKYIKLDSKYRNRFLSKMKISETDNVFIYNYYKDTLVAHTVKNLNVVACLNIYSNEDDKPHAQSDYMIGFEVGKNVIKSFGDYYYESLVYVGKESPFVKGQLKPIRWGKIKTTDFPSKPIATINVLHTRNLDVGNTYTYETADFQFFVQDLLGDGKRPSARHLLIIDIKTKEIIEDVFHFESEGSSPAPLNFTSDNDKSANQWTGKLFRDKPNVYFGFEYISFGCPSITFIDKSVRDVYINCDSRH